MAETLNYSQEEAGYTNGGIFRTSCSVEDKTLLAAVIWINGKINVESLQLGDCYPSKSTSWQNLTSSNLQPLCKKLGVAQK